jgi:hypothetical protein
MPRPKKPSYPLGAPGIRKTVTVDVPSFTKGLVTLVPSDSAGKISAPVGGAQASIQAQTVTFGKDSKDACVVASNVRFRDKATMNAPGYELIGGVDGFSSPFNLIFFSEQGATGRFLIVANADGIFVGTPQ